MCLILTELNPAFYPVSYVRGMLNITSAGCKLPLGGRIYETNAASVNNDHLGNFSVASCYRSYVLDYRHYYYYLYWIGLSRV